MQCQYCFGEIQWGATRCPHCTSDLAGPKPQGEGEGGRTAGDDLEPIIRFLARSAGLFIVAEIGIEQWLPGASGWAHAWAIALSLWFAAKFGKYLP